MAMVRITWTIDVLNAPEDPLDVAQETAKYLQENAMDTAYEVTDVEGNRFGVDLPLEVVVPLEMRPTQGSPSFGQVLTIK